MKFLDAILGKSELPKAKLDKLFAISTASITLETDLGFKPAGKSGICFKPIESSRYESAKSEIEELLQYSREETGTEFHLEKDEYNFLWVVLKDDDFEDLVTSIHMVSQTLTDHGFGEQLLCAVYRFEGKSPVYWIYNFKAGAYYPFAPLSEQKRDNALEFRLRSIMEPELAIEKNEEKWYPLWGMPI